MADKKRANYEYEICSGFVPPTDMGPGRNGYKSDKDVIKAALKGIKEGRFKNAEQAAKYYSKLESTEGASVEAKHDRLRHKISNAQKQPN